MTNSLGPAALTATLRHRLDGALNAAAARNEGVVGARTFSGPPGGPHAGATAGAFIYLYRTSEHPNWRNEDVPTRDQNGGNRTRPTTPLVLRYLITTFGDEATLEPTRVMGVIAAYLHAFPVILPAMIQAAAGSGLFPFMANADLDEQGEHVRLSRVPLEDDGLDRIWSMLPAATFALSAVYDASLILVQEAVTTGSSMPVLQRNALVTTTGRPVIHWIRAIAGAGVAIRVGTPVEVRGEFLRSDAMRVEIDLTAVPAASVDAPSDDRLFFSIPAGTLAGARLVRVVRDLGTLGTSATVQEAASDPAVVLVRPDITNVQKSGGNVRVTLATPLGANQSREILLNRQNGTEAVVRQAITVNPSQIRTPLAGLVAGTYLVRVRIDGVESVPDPPAFAFKTVTAP